MKNKVTAQDIMDYYEASATDSLGRNHPELSWDHDGEVVVCHQPTTEDSGWELIFGGQNDRLESWLDGNELTAEDAEIFAAELNAEIATRR